MLDIVVGDKDYTDRKLAFFDYDRTLVAHNYPHDYLKNHDYKMDVVYMLTDSDRVFEKDSPLLCMQWYTAKLRTEGYDLYVLTHELFNLRNDRKKRMSYRWYGDMEYLTVNEPENKVLMMLGVCEAYNINPANVIFVDDKMDSVYAAINAGFTAWTVSDIVAMYDKELIKATQSGNIDEVRRLTNYERS